MTRFQVVRKVHTSDHSCLSDIHYTLSYRNYGLFWVDAEVARARPGQSTLTELPDSDPSNSYV